MMLNRIVISYIHKQGFNFFLTLNVVLHVTLSVVLNVILNVTLNVVHNNRSIQL